MTYKRILVPVDGSATSAKGLKAAIKLARGSRAKLLLLHVLSDYAAFSTPEAGLNVGPMLEAIKAAGRKTLARVERSARAAGARPETVLAEHFGSRVADVIVKQSKRWRADLIVMGTTARCRSY